MAIDWKDRNDTEALDKLSNKERILVFSPDYPNGDPMQVRIMDKQFLRISTEASHWAVITIPGVDSK